MQILVDFENGDTCNEFGLSFSVIWFADMVAYLWNQNRIVRFLTVLKKTDKNIVAGWNFWLIYMKNIY